MINLIDANPAIIASIHKHLQKKAKLSGAIQRKRDRFEKTLSVLKDRVDAETKAIVELQRGLQTHEVHPSESHKSAHIKPKKQPASKAKGSKVHRAKPGENKNKVIDFLKHIGRGATQSEIAKATQLFAPYINLIIRDTKVFSREKGRGGLITLNAV